VGSLWSGAGPVAIEAGVGQGESELDRLGPRAALGCPEHGLLHALRRRGRAEVQGGLVQRSPSSLVAKQQHLLCLGWTLKYHMRNRPPGQGG
jgi:hypothetical protein